VSEPCVSFRFQVSRGQAAPVACTRPTCSPALECPPCDIPHSTHLRRPTQSALPPHLVRKSDGASWQRSRSSPMDSLYLVPLYPAPCGGQAHTCRLCRLSLRTAAYRLNP